MKIAICGGHLTPALSVIEALSEKDEVYYFGRKYAIEGDRAISLEYQIISDLGIPFVEINTGRIQRTLTKHTVPSFFKIPRGFAQGVRMLVKTRPEVVVGFGGYVSVPVCLAAWVLKIPVIIHEQTQDVGSANKLIGRFAKKICISFQSSEKYFPKNKTVLTGNPVREGLFHPTKKITVGLERPIIYVTGGNLGSHALNKTIQDSLEILLKKYSIIHQTGSSYEFNDFEVSSKLKEKLDGKINHEYLISKFFTTQEVGEILNNVDLVVCRSGINTISELIIFKKPSILIPLPVSQRNEQFKNALLIEKSGLGEIIEQKDLSSELLISKIDNMMKNLDSYKNTNSRNYFPKDSAKRIVEEIYATSKTGN